MHKSCLAIIYIRKNSIKKMHTIYMEFFYINNKIFWLGYQWYDGKIKSKWHNQKHVQFKNYKCINIYA